MKPKNIRCIRFGSDLNWKIIQYLMILYNREILPSLPIVLTLAPFSTRYSTTSRYPLIDAWIKLVNPRSIYNTKGGGEVLTHMRKQWLLALSLDWEDRLLGIKLFFLPVQRPPGGLPLLNLKAYPKNLKTWEIYH